MSVIHKFVFQRLQKNTVKNQVSTIFFSFAVTNLTVVLVRSKFKPTKTKADATNGWQYCEAKIATNKKMYFCCDFFVVAFHLMHGWRIVNVTSCWHPDCLVTHYQPSAISFIFTQ